MKANQSFRNSEEAVSPVIGVILMVAITVILAVVVFALVTRLSQTNSNPSPKVNVSSEDNQAGGGDLTVLSIANNPAGGGIDWSDITFTGAATCAVGMNMGSVAAGDIIACSANGSWNMVWTAAGSTAGVVVAKGAFPTS